MDFTGHYKMMARLGREGEIDLPNYLNRYFGDLQLNKIGDNEYEYHALSLYSGTDSLYLDFKFTLGIQFEEELDGKVYNTKFTAEGDVLYQESHSGDEKYKIIREFNQHIVNIYLQDQVKVTFEVNDILLPDYLVLVKVVKGAPVMSQPQQIRIQNT